MPVVSINQHRINVTETGDGQDVILAVHSSGKSHRQWQGLGERAAESYRLVAADVFGHGRTDAWSGDADMSLASEVAVLQSLVANLPGRRVHLVGHSYGGADPERHLTVPDRTRDSRHCRGIRSAGRRHPLAHQELAR